MAKFYTVENPFGSGINLRISKKVSGDPFVPKSIQQNAGKLLHEVVKKPIFVQRVGTLNIYAALGDGNHLHTTYLEPA